MKGGSCHDWPIGAPEALPQPGTVKGNIRTASAVVVRILSLRCRCRTLGVTAGVKMNRLDLNVARVAQTKYLAGTAHVETKAQ
ncbi:MAG: hypothetical protein DRP45_06735 [Candidatus Zixiibacteriota bacterium]|nr:MAG: hypothetical protein DRP45_06735 [candidate division Zixibacteria bacterium]